MTSIVEATQQAIVMNTTKGLACNKSDALQQMAHTLAEDFDYKGLIGVEFSKHGTNVPTAPTAPTAPTHSLVTNAWQKPGNASYNHPDQTKQDPSEKPSQNNRRKYPPLIK